jgi:hypothetical protein
MSDCDAPPPAIWLLDPVVKATALLAANLLNFLATPSEALVFREICLQYTVKLQFCVRHTANDDLVCSTL